MNRALYISQSISDAGLASEANTVVTSMKDNRFFPTAAAMVLSMEAAYNLFIAALADAAYGGRAAKAAKNNARQALQLEGRTVCDEVNKVAQGNRAMLSTSGYRVGAAITLPVQTEPVKSFNLVNGKNPGEVVARVKKGAGTMFVLIEYAVGNTLEPAMVWHACPDSKATCIITGLTSGSRVWARATVVGRRGQKLMTPAISTIVL